VASTDGGIVHELEGDSGTLDHPNFLPDLTNRLISTGAIPEGSNIGRLT
jgi:hypothetical protein